MKETPRVRMFAGPNGSGKSTLKASLPSALFSSYINPDDIQLSVSLNGFFDASIFDIVFDQTELTTFFLTHPLAAKIGGSPVIEKVKLFGRSKIDLSNVLFDSYFSSVLSDFFRKHLIQERKSFTFETVMSSEDKLVTLKLAREQNFRTYLYFVGTEHSGINLERVANRVLLGGHAVPAEKVMQRYVRSLGLLSRAIEISNRAYIFDNSYDKMVFIAEVTEGTQVDLKANVVPKWFDKAYLNT